MHWCIGVVVFFVLCFKMFSILNILKRLLSEAFLGIRSFFSFLSIEVPVIRSSLRGVESPFRDPIVEQGRLLWSDTLIDEVDDDIPLPVFDDGIGNLDVVEVLDAPLGEVILSGNAEVETASFSPISGLSEIPLDDDQVETISDLRLLNGEGMSGLSTPSTEVFPSGSSCTTIRLSRRVLTCKLPVCELPEQCDVQGCKRPPYNAVTVDGVAFENRCEYHSGRRSLRTFLRLYGTFVLERLTSHKHSASCQVVARFDVSLRPNVEIILVDGWPAFKPKWVSKPGLKTGEHKHKCTNCHAVYTHSHRFGEPLDEVHPDFPGDCVKCSVRV